MEEANIDKIHKVNIQKLLRDYKDCIEATIINDYLDEARLN